MTPVNQGFPAKSSSSEGEPKGHSRQGGLRVDFHRTVRLTFLESKVTSDAGRLAYRELDEALGLSATGGKRLDNFRTVRNTRHALLPLIRQSTYSRLAGYEYVTDMERLCVDQAYRTSWAAAPVRLCLGLQPRELPPPAGTSKVCPAVVADHAEGEARQDRCQGHPARQVRDVPAGGSRCAPTTLRFHPRTDRQT
ncbi:MAG: hypothetical protein RLZZ326_1394 [Planctomycetota bacterium]